MNKVKFTGAGLEPATPNWRAGALPTELYSPTLAVSLFFQYLCSGASVRSYGTIYCPLARDHAQVTMQPGKRPYEGIRLFCFFKSWILPWAFCRRFRVTNINSPSPKGQVRVRVWVIVHGDSSTSHESQKSDLSRTWVRVTSHTSLSIRPKEVSGFWSPRALPQSSRSAFLILYLLLWNDVQLQPKLMHRLEFFRAVF